MDAEQTPKRSPSWWKDVVIYQIYPRSFNDSNGDGIGDLSGITERVDHLAELGVDVVWISPHFDSPNADNGYDIRDYYRVMAEFGTMADFDRMLAALNQRGIDLVLDLVVNHTSDEHQWFQESRSSRDNPYRDYYIWRDGSPDGGPPNNYMSFFGGSAWTHDPATDQWYLHYFDVKQPDLNWENPDVRSAVIELMRFWLDKGVAGFRMDVIPFISKQPGLPDLTPEQMWAPQNVYADGPRVHEFLQLLGREVLKPYEAVSIGEAIGVTPEQMPLFIDQARGELSMMIMFDLVRLDILMWQKAEWELPQFKEVVARMDRGAGQGGWTTSYLGSHDGPRTVSHFGSEDPRWRDRSAKALATFILTQRGTPIIYQGDEIGMTNYPFGSIEEFDDVAARGGWKQLVETGAVPADEYLANLRQTSRDNARTPMQWDGGPGAGFTTGDPWLAINPNHTEINVAAQLADPDSVFHHHRRLIKLRHRMPVLVHGAFEDLDPHHEQVFAYTRSLDGDRVLVIINFGDEPVDYRLPDEIGLGDLLIDNIGVAPSRLDSGNVRLDAWQAAVYTL